MVDKLETKTIAVGTAIGMEVKEDNRAKLKLIGHRFQEEQIVNMSAICLGRIGVNKNNSHRYLDKLCSLFGFNKSFQQHFRSQIADKPEKVYVVIGQRTCSALLVPVTAEQLGTRHPWILPNIKIYYNPLTNSLLLAGHMGIEEELVDQDYPQFLVHRDTWKKMQDTTDIVQPYSMMAINEL